MKTSTRLLITAAIAIAATSANAQPVSQMDVFRQKTAQIMELCDHILPRMANTVKDRPENTIKDMRRLRDALAAVQDLKAGNAMKSIPALFPNDSVDVTKSPAGKPAAPSESSVPDIF